MFINRIIRYKKYYSYSVSTGIVMNYKNKLKKDIIQSNLSKDSKKQLISLLDKNMFIEVVKIFIGMLNLGSNIMDFFNDED